MNLIQKYGVIKIKVYLISC